MTASEASPVASLVEHVASTPERVRVAVVQAEVAPTLAAGLDRTVALTHDAATRGASLVVFPETWLPGYPAWLDVCRDVALWDHAPVKTVFRRLVEESVALPSAAASTLSMLARDTNTTLVIGVVERVNEGKGQGTLYNTILTFGADGVLLNRHRKLVPTYTERLLWGPGDATGLRAVATPAGRVGALVCWEHWMPLARQALHDAGEDVHVALWPTVHEMHQVASRQYAFEGRCFVLAAGSLMRASSLPPELEWHPSRVSSADQRVLRGGSAIIGPDGAYVAGPVFDEPALIVADIELGRVREERMSLDVAGHYGRPDIFEFRVRAAATVTNAGEGSVARP
ncbi:MAG: carbon-nitrogen hydrolase family protein [Gemmatimonadaceae bacterium]